MKALKVSKSEKKNLCLIIAYNLKYHFTPHAILAVLLLLITPLLFGIKNLDAAAVSAVLELFISLLGTVLLTPVFMPESKAEIEDTVASKYVSSLFVAGLRIICGICALAIFISAFSFILYGGNCDISVKMSAGCFVSALFLGAAGVLAYAAADNIAAAYMVSLMIYGINFAGGKKLGSFYLFSMLSGEYKPKIGFFIAALALIIAALKIKAVKMHK